MGNEIVGKGPGESKDTKPFVPPWLDPAAPGNSPEERKKRQEAAERAYAASQAISEAEKFRTMARANEAATKVSENQVEIEKLKVKQAELKAGSVIRSIKKTDPDAIVLEVAMNADETTKIDYLYNPFTPRGQMVGYYGRGSTGKSTLIATINAELSKGGWANLWVSTEEEANWIKVRHIKAGGTESSLFVVKAVVKDHDKDGRAITSSFNIYEDLEPAIEKTLASTTKPLATVTLDTMVALTTWERHAGPNSDQGVKELTAYLRFLSEKYGICINGIGHSNKGKHEQLADTVAGAAAWTTSPRQAFVCLNDKRQDEHHFIITSVKHSLTGKFAMDFRTVPIHTLFTRPDGSDSVLCRIASSWNIQWGQGRAEALENAAMGRDENGEQMNSTTRKDMSIDEIMTTVLNLVGVGTPGVTRKVVEAAMGRKASNRHWQEADQALAGRGVVSGPGLHGELTYARSATPPL